MSRSSYTNAYQTNQRPYGRIFTVITPLFTLSCIIGLVTFQLLHFSFVKATNQEQQDVTFSNALVPFLANSHLEQQVDPQQRLNLSIGLQPRQHASVNEYLQSISYAKSQHNHNAAPAISVTQEENNANYAQHFSPDNATYTLVENFLRQSGFAVTRTYTHRLLIEFTGSVAQAEKIFGVKIKSYTSPDQQNSYFANSQAPRLPEQIGKHVLSINGLNNATQWQHSAPKLQAIQGKKLFDKRGCPKVQQQALLPSQFATAYNMHSLYKAGYQGQGQSVALFELSSLPTEDLTPYIACFGNKNTQIKAIDTGITAATQNEGSVQALQDAQLILSTLPRLAKLQVYQTVNNDVSYLAQWARILEDKPSVVASSWYQCEAQLLPQTIQQEHVFFQLAAIQRQTILASAGNKQCSSTTASTYVGTNDPAAQPFVTGVGDTALTLEKSSYKKETATNMFMDEQLVTRHQSISKYWIMPTWQRMIGVPNPTTSSSEPCTQNNRPNNAYCREIPDVSLNTGEQRGYLFYCSIPNYCDVQQPWSILSGSGISTPLWAALVTLTNQMLAQQGQDPVGFLNPLLYELANNPVTYAQSFHDVTDKATNVGYDAATGLGSYNAYNLANQLVELVKSRRTHK